MRTIIKLAPWLIAVGLIIYLIVRAMGKKDKETGPEA